MRRATALTLGVIAAGVVGLVLAATLHTTPLAFTLGVSPSAAVAPLAPGATACQRPIDVPAGGEFDAITAHVTTYGRPGPPLRAVVRRLGGGVLASGRLAGGYADYVRSPTQRIALDRRVPVGRISVCLRNRGPTNAALYGNGDLAARPSTGELDGKPLHYDLALEFQRSPRSIATLLPDMLSRAALFRFPWMGGWTYVVLIALVVLGGPWLLLRALRAATEPAVTPSDGARRPRPPRS
jgi:hypothetical protein